MSVRLGWALPPLFVFVTGCPAPQTDPPPPLRSAEIPMAPPSALGALAGGTDAAPRPEAGLPGLELEPAVPPSGDGGATPPVPAPSGSEDDSSPGLPDAGMAL